MTFIDGSCPVGRISSSLIIPIMKTVRSDSYQCHLFNVEEILSFNVSFPMSIVCKQIKLSFENKTTLKLRQCVLLILLILVI